MDMSVDCESQLRLVWTDSALLLSLSKCSLDVLHAGWLCSGEKEGNGYIRRLGL